jgi:hypothetical protein
MADDFTYSIDTSALVHGWVRAYPITVPMFRPVWDKLDELIENGRLRASAEVLTEIKKKDDDLAAWCEKHPALFVEIEDGPIQEQVANLLAKYPRLVDTRRGRDGADPFVIAYAMSCNPIRTVITQEQGGTLEKPKIPVVCDAEDVRCINLLQLLTEQS